jgi:hypothetical protein
MPTLRDWLIEAAAGEPIVAVVFGRVGTLGAGEPLTGHDWPLWDDDMEGDNIPGYRECPFHKIVSWQNAQPWLNNEFSCGLGAPQCQAVYAWTAYRVIFIHNYDGATGVRWVPTMPAECMPNYNGTRVNDD